MATIATLERVREAKLRLLKSGQHPSADRIIVALQGGSKTTVITHLKALAAEDAHPDEPDDVPVNLLMSSATALSRRLWEEAKNMASATYEQRIRAMLAAQTGLYDELQLAAEREEQLERELRSTRDRLAQMEAELAGRSTADGQLEKIFEMLRSQQPPQYKPIIQLLRLLEQSEREVGDLLQRMVDLGHQRKQAVTAKSHALAYGYATERDSTGDAAIRITEKGRQKLKATPGTSRHRKKTQNSPISN